MKHVYVFKKKAKKMSGERLDQLIPVLGYNLPEMSTLFLLIYLNKCTSSNRTNIYKHALFYLHQSPLTKTHANYLVQIERNVLCHKIFSAVLKAKGSSGRRRLI